jgi:tRNA-2-methylthio-N6-dimethylallyladenosine synthase
MAEEVRRRAPYVDIILGPRNLSALRGAVQCALADERLPTWVTDTAELPDDTQPAARAEGVSAFVNVTYGCDNFCAYCVVPYARGREVSRRADDILAEVREVVAEGFHEVTLLGQNVNSYRDPDDGTAFPDLLRAVGAMEGLWRLRFTTSHPKDCSAALLRALAETPTACEHLHLPIQAGDDEVLARMGRGYTYAHYRGLVDQAREVVPGLAVTTDVMVGFPGETEVQFERTLAAFAEMRFDQAFMFKYSDRPGTAAEAMPGKVPETIKQAWLERLVALQNEVSRQVNVAQEWQVFEVLVEGRDAKSPDKWRGRTRGNKLMVFAGGADRARQLVRVRAVRGFLWGYVGEEDANA